MQNLNNLLKKALKITSQIYSDEMANRQQVSYRITKLPDEKDPYVHYQLVGKNLATKTLPEALLKSNALMGFSKTDIAVITYLGVQQQMAKQQSTEKPKLSAGIAQQLLGTSGKTKFLLKMPEQDQLVEAIPEEVMMNLDALDMLSGKDAAILGYAAAENRLMDIRQQVSQSPTCYILEHDLIENRVTYLDEERDTKHTLPLNDIFNNKKLLKLFNKIDQQMISFTAGEAYQQRISNSFPALTIISQSNETLICQDAEGQERELSFIDVAFNEDLLFSFSLRDQHLIRFVAGELHAKRKMYPQPTLKILSRSEDQIEYVDLEGSAYSKAFELLVFNRDLLEQFSVLDREQILYAAGEAYQKRIAKKLKPAFYIVSQTDHSLTYCNEAAEEFEIAFMDLAFDEVLLLQFSPREQHLVRFVAGELHAKKTALAPVLLKLVSQQDERIEYIDQNATVHTTEVAQVAFDRELLEQFKIEEREKIIFAAGEWHQKRLHTKKSITLVLTTYLGDTAQFTDLDGNIKTMRFQELAFKSEILDQFCQQDRDMIRFAAGELSVQKKVAL